MEPKKRGKTSFRKDNSSLYSLFSRLNQEDIKNLDKLIELLSIKEKNNLTFDEIKKSLNEKLIAPVSIFNKELTPLESVVKFLKEEKQLSLRSISISLGRDERNIWGIYNKSKRKNSEKFAVKDVKYWIPVSIFSNEKLSAQESLVYYLKEEFGLTYHEIAILLERDDRTVWTVYQRAKEKNVK